MWENMGLSGLRGQMGGGGGDAPREARGRERRNLGGPGRGATGWSLGGEYRLRWVWWGLGGRLLAAAEEGEGVRAGGPSIFPPSLSPPAPAPSSPCT